MNCPVCNAGLSAKYFGKSKVMHCPSCGGFWVGAKRLSEVLERYMRLLAERHDSQCGKRERVNPWKVEKVRVICPECGRTMTKLNYAYNSNVIVDTCDTCGGVWLDKGEIEKIAAFLKYCGLPENVKEEMARIREHYNRHGGGGQAVRDDLDNLGDMLLSLFNL